MWQRCAIGGGPLVGKLLISLITPGQYGRCRAESICSPLHIVSKSRVRPPIGVFNKQRDSGNVVDYSSATEDRKRKVAFGITRSSRRLAYN